MFTCALPGDAFLVVVLAKFELVAGRSFDPFGSLSSGARCLVVSLIWRGDFGVVRAGLLLGGGFIFGLVISELFDPADCFGVAAVVMGGEV